MLKRWNRISCIALVLAAFSPAQVARAETAANAFVVVEAEGVRIGDGDVIHFANATSATPVRVTARTGWRVNGKKEISFVRAANESGSLHLVSVLGEDETHIPYEDCTFDYTVATNHVLAPKITASASPAQQIALYASPETSAEVPASANVTLLQEGEHEIVTTWKPCPRCGATRSPSVERRRVSTSPSVYAWTATAGGVATNSSTWTGRLAKGLGQEVVFFVAGENGCSQCECRASTAAAVDVCEVSIDRPDFIGLDRTDSGRANPTIYSAAVNLDPEPSATISYDWRDCGICSFTGRTDQARVRYFAPDPDRASASFLAEPLTVAVSVGDSASTTCTTNFTVVKVDVSTDSLSGVVAESGEENVGAYVHWNVDNDDDSGCGTGSPKHPGGDYLQTEDEVANENDLVRLVCSIEPMMNSGVISLTSRKASLWSSRSKGLLNHVKSADVVERWDLADPVARSSFAAIEGGLFVEGVAEGDGLLTLTYAMNGLEAKDAIKYTFVAANCGRQPRTDTGEKAELEDCFPRLVGCEWSVTGEATNGYNCIAWSVGETNRWYNPSDIDGYYGDGDGRLTVVEMDAFYFEKKGWLPTEAGDAEVKAVFYSGYHGARRKDCHCGSGHWMIFESKCGSAPRIEHVRDQLNGSVYGAIIRCYK